jgi:DNA-binding NtrC family response regulator
MNAQNLRVLVVDDDPDVLWAMDRRLQQAGFNVVTCNDGQKAYEELERRHFDALITDIMMPKLNGLALLDWVRTNRPELMTVVMTAFDSPSVRRLSLGSGAAMVLGKPADADTIIETLTSRLNENNAVESTHA